MMISESTAASALEIVLERQRLSRDATGLSAVLHDLVPGKPRSARRRLLRLRRDLFNLRRPRAQDIGALDDEDVRDEVAALDDRIRSLGAAVECYERTYVREDAAIADRLVRACSDTDFRAGLRLSSRSLSAVLDLLLEREHPKPDRKTERGLLRYLSRAAGKATPFGRFCAISDAGFAPTKEPLHLTGDPSRKWSRIRVNKRVMRAVLSRLMSEDESRRRLPIRLNPTVRAEENGFFFLASSPDREAFQFLAENRAIRLVVEKLRDSQEGTIRSLAVEILTLKDLDATEEEAEAYLDGLFEIGLLQLDLPGLGHEPNWPGALAPVLEGMASEGVASEELAFLERLDALVRDLQARSEGGVDAEGLQSLEKCITSTLDGWFEHGFRFSGPTVYEDAATRGQLHVDPRHFASAFGRLTELLGLLVPAVWSRRKAFAMRQFYERQYGAGRIPLQEFYEAYFRDLRNTDADARGESEPEDVEAESGEDTPQGAVGKGAESGPEEDGPDAVAVKAAHMRLSQLLSSRWAEDPKASALNVSKSELQDALRGVPVLPEEPCSLSAFVTLVPRPRSDDGGMIVLPHAQTFAGYGKYFSRFLYLLPDEVLGDLRADAEEHQANGDVVLAEIAGDAAFNANFRPFIQPCEIPYPSGDRIGCPSSIDVGELEVEPSDCGRRLYLFDRGTGRKVLPLDVGFLNPRARPPLYQLLRWLGPTSATYMGLPVRPNESSTAARDGASTEVSQVRRRPRITFENTVVIARESWRMYPDGLPSRPSEESEADFFLRVTAWRLNVGLPETVYVHVRPKRRDHGSKGGVDRASEESARTGRARRRRSSDLGKPQYVDFRSPPLVRLLEGYAKLGDAFVIVFEECLPTAEELPKDQAGRQWVSEAVVQLEITRRADASVSRVERAGRVPEPANV